MTSRIIIIFIFIFPTITLNAQTWNNLGNGTPSEIYVMKEYNGKLVLGAIGPIGNISKGIASWDGTSWDSLGPGTAYGKVGCIALYNNELIAAGEFYAMGSNFPIGIPNTRLIAAWNGSQWHSLGSGAGLSGFGIYAIAVYNGELYVGGDFIDMGGVSCHRIARWNGTTWNVVSSGLTGAMPVVYSMCVYDGELYVGGNFQFAGGIPANGIARWNGTQWDSVGAGIYGWPFAMIVDSVHNNLIIGGNFACPDSTFGLCICGWNGANYFPFANGLNEVVHSLAIYNNYLYASMPSINGTVYDTVLVYWDSVSWKPVLGPNDIIESLVTYKNELYCGGYFTQIDSLNISFIARYSNPTLNIGESEINKGILKAIPNPSGGSVKLSYSLNSFSKEIMLQIYNSSGKKVLSKKIYESTGNYFIGEGILPKGVYIAKIENKKEKLATKFVIE